MSASPFFFCFGESPLQSWLGKPPQEMNQEIPLHLHSCIPGILFLGDWSPTGHCLMNVQRKNLLPPEKNKLDANKEKGASHCMAERLWVTTCMVTSMWCPGCFVMHPERLIADLCHKSKCLSSSFIFTLAKRRSICHTASVEDTGEKHSRDDSPKTASISLPFIICSFAGLLVSSDFKNVEVKQLL